MPDHETVIAATKTWLEKAVIGLNLCPFAKAVYVKNQVRIRVSEASTPQQLAEELADELQLLAQADPEEIDTTLLVHPKVLQRFLDFNDFQDIADAIVEELELDGVLQVASFHPKFQFEGTGINDVENYTNRSPYPTLHLIREESIDRAVAAFPEAEAIYERNIETMRQLGAAGWKTLFEHKAD
ncbi:DUF1415 family protein [Chromobacterium subtsugae]|uniref:DUF1415 family protein n=2 Tax=Chromobacterium subtsugae TaxID=251747 RepID=A0ABS7FAR0_9NEIS|nr:MULTISPECIES: DUF1415 domain-containing protein [Chromobacterium]KUM02976.1 peptidase [Chromobacterium subtsugae]KZE87247.1 peptidase [Chromobacterium sp. F49]MBW7565796.1 DUF1415 domain-containing protein [Chromobacterium subtsugae]MBW8287164.1 DUF1415 family protein [Chromobacterium subtsugae]OBU88090.1 peptidase [Chromobacterium subtsugae]